MSSPFWRFRVARVAIVGAGPSGLTLANLLASEALAEVTLFEAGPRVGGKSHTTIIESTVCEMGTCYTTRGDQVLRQWMDGLGIQSSRIGKARMDGQPFDAFVKKAPGAPLSWQVIKYLWLRQQLLAAHEATPDNPEVLAKLASPVGDWLAGHGLAKMERFCLKALTVMGYGYLDNTPTLHALRWIDWSLITSGVLNDLRMPADGWSHFWETLSRDFDVRLNTPVRQVDRAQDDVWIHTENGVDRFDRVVCAMPVDDFCKLTAPTPSETIVRDGVSWGRYATTLCSVDGWFTKEQSRNFSDALLASRLEGMLLSARREGYAKALNGHLYLLGQIPGEYTAPELAEIARARIAADGGAVTSVIEQKIWKYFPKYEPDAIRAGLLETMVRMQGDQNTFYTGSTFSHEAVGRILTFNRGLARLMSNDLKTAGYQPAPIAA